MTLLQFLIRLWGGSAPKALGLTSIRLGLQKVLITPPAAFKLMVAPLLIESLIRVSSDAGTRTRETFCTQAVVKKFVKLFAMLLLSVTIVLL